MPTRTVTVLGRVIERGPWHTVNGLGVAEIRDVATDLRCLLLRWADMRMTEASPRYARIPAPVDFGLASAPGKTAPDPGLMLYLLAVAFPSEVPGSPPTINPRHALGTPWRARSEEDAIRDMIRGDHALGEVGR